jgi:hypothetical protein
VVVTTCGISKFCLERHATLEPETTASRIEHPLNALDLVTLGCEPMDYFLFISSSELLVNPKHEARDEKHQSHQPKYAQNDLQR